MKKKLCYFMPSEHLLSNLLHQRLKVSRFSDCNDVFELGNFRSPARAKREESRGIRKQLRCWSIRQNNKWGLICFSRDHYSPLMWAHYADRNRGACLEFTYEPKKETPNNRLLPVNYTTNREEKNLEEARKLKKLSEPTLTDAELIKLCATKESAWRYEKEERLLISLNTKENQCVYQDNGFYFFHWPKMMKLETVWLGPNPDICVDCIKKLLLPHHGKVEVKQKRAAFRGFQIVLQRSQKLHKSCPECSVMKDKE